MTNEKRTLLLASCCVTFAVSFGTVARRVDYRVSILLPRRVIRYCLQPGEPALVPVASLRQLDQNQIRIIKSSRESACSLSNCIHASSRRLDHPAAVLTVL